MSAYKPGAWVRFTRAWDWIVPGKHGRAHKHFREGREVRLNGSQLQSAMAVGVVELIPNPRHARSKEAGDA